MKNTCKTIERTGLRMRGFHCLHLPVMLAAALSIAGCSSLQRDAEAPAVRARNVIVMINDGAGWGTWDAAAYWQYGRRDGAPYASFPARYGMSTFPLNTSRTPTGDPNPKLGYAQEAAWDVTPTGDAALPFAGYRALAAAATDSAAAGTALSSGVKTYNNAINVDNAGQPVVFNTLRAKQRGMATGVVTSVPFSHATPAAFAAQNRSRNHYHEIAHQMLAQGHLDLVMGAGGPGYDVNGEPCTPHPVAGSGCDKPFEFIAASDWERLHQGRFVSDDGGNPWALIRSRSEFERLADGALVADAPLIGVPQVARTLQQAREAARFAADDGTASGVAMIATVPSLATMTRGALRHLARRSSQGIFLMVEGGATDWAAHTSSCGTEWTYSACTDEPQYGRLIEETVDFNNAVAAVVEWVEANSNWDETLLIVTTDHDNSLPMGPDAQRVAYQPVVNHGKGKMPGISFRPTGNHSNALVPLWAKGAGSAAFEARVRGVDPGYARHVGLSDGRYIDNTDVAEVVRMALDVGAKTP